MKIENYERQGGMSLLLSRRLGGSSAVLYEIVSMRTLFSSLQRLILLFCLSGISNGGAHVSVTGIFSESKVTIEASMHKSHNSMVS
jgi:hypothetical protein